MEKQESNLHPVKDLLLKEKDFIFTVYSKDIIKSQISRKLRKKKKKNDVIESEYCYCLPSKTVQFNQFYRNQLPNARYTKLLCILDDQEQAIQKVPILKVVQSEDGALNFGIDRLAFTEEMKKYIRKEECNE
ncbi:hypothetical protein FP329_002542 [Enterococcus faecium]|nr:hypothetical protein [Enterococcus faecium]